MTSKEIYRHIRRMKRHPKRANCKWVYVTDPDGDFPGRVEVYQELEIGG